MTVKRMDHVGIVVEDLDAAVAFFVELGMELEGQASVGGEWADQLLALDGVQADIAMLRTPDGHSRIESVNTPGIPRIAFVVGDVNETFDRLRAHGAELVGEIAQYEDIYLYGYVRGPADVIVGLVEELD
jgi:catechol 2,3-dioxygenase-like lactoylglutathione lyase family enzyme